MLDSELEQFISDAPISNVAMDLFGHALIASKLADAITTPGNRGSNVIGLQGSWGTGKTGILNLLEGELNSRNAPKIGAAELRVSVIRFQPWLVGSKHALLASFFGQFIRAIDEIRHSNLDAFEIDKRRTRKALKRLKTSVASFAEVVSATANAAVLFDSSGAASVVSAAAGAANPILKKLRSGEASLEQRRDEVLEALRSVNELVSNLRFVVILDDLDRLESEEALEVLRLVKSVGDLPFVSYVVGYDRDVLAKAIEGITPAEDGYAFMEKVFQFSFAVPNPEAGALSSWLQRTLSQEFPNKIDFRTRRASVVLRIWGGRLLKTPRSIRKLVSALKIMWPALCDDTDLLDLVWIEMLKENASSGDKNLYGWVYNYLENIEGVANGEKVVVPSETSQELQKLLKNLGWYSLSSNDEGAGIDPHYLNDILPGISASYLTDHHPIKCFDFDGSSNWKDFVPERRLGSPRHWRLYFSFDTPSRAFSDAAMARLVDSSEVGDQKLLSDLLDIIAQNQEQYPQFLEQIFGERLEATAKSFSSLVAKSWASALMSIPPKLPKVSEYEHEFGFIGDFQRSFRQRVVSLCTQASESNTGEVLLDIAQATGVPWSVAEVLSAELDFHKSSAEGSPSFDSEKVVSEKELNLLSEYADNLFSNMTWPEFNRSLSKWKILFCWHEFNAPSASSWLEKMLEDNSLLTDRLYDLRTFSYSSEVHDHLPSSFFALFLNSKKLFERLSEVAHPASELSSERALHLLSIWRNHGESTF